MAQELFKGDSLFRSLIDRAESITGADLEEVCLSGPESELMKSANLQPLMVAISLSYLRVITEAGVKPDYTAGHSLGELTALAASGVISDEFAVEIAARRGMLMDRAASKCNGGMKAVISMPLIEVVRVLSEMDKPDKISVANDNAPKQVVISGDMETMDEFTERVSGRARVVDVKVSGPWHSAYISLARDEFARWILPVEYSAPSVSLVMNATGVPVEGPEIIKELSTDQLVRPVFWKQSMNFLKHQGVDLIAEVGPGGILSGFARVNGFKKRNIFPVDSFRNAEGFCRKSG